MKVYCSFCKFYKKTKGDDLCLSNPGVWDTPVNREITLGQCSYKNKDNHCKEFKPKFSYRIKHLFGFYSRIEKSRYNFKGRIK